MKNLKLTLIGLGLALVAGCAPGVSSFVRTDVDISYIQRVAVCPFYNLSQDVHAGQRLHSIFVSDVLSREALQVLELGETLHGMSEQQLSADSQLSADQIVALGKTLGVDAIFFGTIEEYGRERIGNGRTYSVTANFRLMGTDTGSKIWSAQNQASGSSIWRRLFGGGSASLYAVSQTVVHESLDTIF